MTSATCEGILKSNMMKKEKKNKKRFRPTPAFYDLLIIIAIGIAAFFVSSILSLHSIFDELLKDVKVGKVSGNELPILFAILMLCFMVFSLRRWLEMRHEVYWRMIVEKDLKKHQIQLEDMVIELTRQILELHKKVEEESKKHRDHLEETIATRTRELVDSEKRFRTIFDESPEGLIIAEIDTKRFSMFNRSICEMLGYSEEEMKGLSVNDIHPKDELPRVLEHFESQVRGGHEVAELLPVKRKGGSVFYADVTASPVTLAGKIYLMGSFRDVTSRVRAEEKLKASEESYRAIFESANDAIVTRDIDTYRIADVNNRACEMFCYSKAEMLGLEFEATNVNSAEYSSEKFRQFLSKAAKDEPQLFEWSVKDKFGRQFWVEINMRRAVIRGQYRLLAVVRDITERRQLLEQKDDFVNMVSHELRTPLGAIKESIALISEGKIGPIDEKQREIIDVAKRNVERLKRLIDQTLDLQKIDAGRMELNIEEHSINEMIKEVHRTMISLAAKGGLYFTVKLDETLPPVKCDRDKIIEVVINLINNSIKFTQTGGITVTSSRGNNFIQVSVADTGSGIKSEDMWKLFQRFAQLERKAGGTGLGLTISKEIAEMHKGKLWAESEFGKGTTFHLVLPIKERRT